MSSVKSSMEQNFGSVEVSGFKECNFYSENVTIVGSDLSQGHSELSEKKILILKVILILFEFGICLMKLLL